MLPGAKEDRLTSCIVSVSAGEDVEQLGDNEDGTYSYDGAQDQSTQVYLCRILVALISRGVTYASCAAYVSEAEPGLLAAIRDVVGIRVTAFRRRLASRIHLRRHRYLIVGLWTLLQVDHGTRGKADSCTKTADRIKASSHVSQRRSQLDNSSATRTTKMNSVVLAVSLFLLFTFNLSEAMDPNIVGKKKVSRGHSKAFGHRPSNGLISFNSEDEKFRIDWAVTIPFISIPINNKYEEHGEAAPLLNVNTKAIGVVGLLTTLFSVVKPLFSKPQHPHLNYRSGDNTEWSQMGNAINEMLFSNNYVAPCMQRVLCSAVSVATHADNPTSTDKIIDGLSSHRWFKDAINGTIIQDAVAAGQRGNQDCARIYQDCLITPKLLKTVMNEFGIV